MKQSSTPTQGSVDMHPPGTRRRDSLSFGLTVGNRRLTGPSKGQSSFAWGSWLGICFCVLLGVCMMRTLSDIDSMPTLASFLQYLADAPSIDVSWVSVIRFDLNFPDWLVWAEHILEYTFDMISVICFCGTALINCLLYIVYFLRYLLF